MTPSMEAAKAYGTQYAVKDGDLWKKVTIENNDYMRRCVRRI